MPKKTFILICSILLVTPIIALAGDNHNHAQQDISNINGEIITVEGTLVCKSCSLKKEFGARAACKDNGCQIALQTADGHFVDFLDNKYAQDLKGQKYAGSQIKVTGTYFANAHTIDVQSFTVDGKTKSWCNKCQAMDGCAVNK